MDPVSLLLEGFATAITPGHLLWALIGVTIGTAVGVLPGIGPALTVALLLPITFRLDPASALILFAGIYYGGMYGGSTTAILLNVPGESASMVTALEGNKMARAGRARGRAGHRRDRQLRRGHHRHDRVDVRRARGRRFRDQLRPTGILRADGGRIRDGECAAGRQPGQGRGQPARRRRRSG